MIIHKLALFIFLFSSSYNKISFKWLILLYEEERFLLGIKRSTGAFGILGRIKIYVDEKEVATIKQNQQIEIHLSSDEANIYVKQVGSQSNELVVKA